MDNRNTVIILLVCTLLFTLTLIQRPVKNYEYIKSEKTSDKAEIVNLHKECSEKFNAMKYEEASDCFKQLLTMKDSSSTRYNIALSLGYAKQFDEAVEILSELRESEIKSELFKKKIDSAYWEFLKHKNIAESFKRSDVGNYFGDIKDFAKWKNPRQIKVYIYSDYDKRPALYEAFKKWDSELRSTVDFVYVRDPQEADITARAVDIATLEGINSAGTTLSNYSFYSNNKNKQYIETAQISVSYNSSGKNSWSDEEFQGIALHEIGHALGIKGHSKHKGDIMYFDISTYRKGTISNRDVNTVKMIYGNLAN